MVHILNICRMFKIALYGDPIPNSKHHSYVPSTMPVFFCINVVLHSKDLQSFRYACFYWTNVMLEI